MAKCVICGKVELSEDLKVCEGCSGLKPVEDGFLEIKDGVKAGSFREAPPATADEIKRLEQMMEQEPEPTVSGELVECYEIFCRETGVEPKVVFYPSCATDVSPISAFPNSRVIFCDKDEKSAKALQNAGYEAYAEKIQEFEIPEPADLVILLNPQIPSGHATKFLKDGGYILANNYHGNASQMRTDESFELVGVINHARPDKAAFFDRENLAEYFEKVETDEEFKKSSEYLFNLAKKEVKEYLGVEENIVSNYKKLCDKYYDPSLGCSMDVETQNIFLGLPNKKGTVDELWVYKKK